MGRPGWVWGERESWGGYWAPGAPEAGEVGWCAYYGPEYLAATRGKDPQRVAMPPGDREGQGSSSFDAQLTRVLKVNRALSQNRVNIQTELE